MSQGLIGLCCWWKYVWLFWQSHHHIKAVNTICEPNSEFLSVKLCRSYGNHWALNNWSVLMQTDKTHNSVLWNHLRRLSQQQCTCLFFTDTWVDCHDPEIFCANPVHEMPQQAYRQTITVSFMIPYYSPLLIIFQSISHRSLNLCISKKSGAHPTSYSVDTRSCLARLQCTLRMTAVMCSWCAQGQLYLVDFTLLYLEQCWYIT